VTADLSPRTRRVLLGLVVLGAAVLRFAGLDHHLRYGAPDFDERNNFIEPVLRMWWAGTPDPTVYMGYAGFFNWLIFLPVGLGNRLAGEPGAYLAGRAVVAAFGTLSVWLVYRGVRDSGGVSVALAAAALLAVSRVEVRQAHHITPDVLIGTAALALIAIVSRAGSRVRDVSAGAIVGLATAIKYSGLLLAPALAVAFVVERRWRGLVLAAGAAALAFAVAAPYAVQRSTEQGSGLAGGLQTYYGADPATNQFTQGKGTSALALPAVAMTSLGLPACLVALVSAASWRRPPVVVGWAVVFATFAATIPANLVNSRHVIPATAALAFLFGVGLHHLARWRGIAVAAGALAILWPVPETLSLVARYVRPAGVDRAAQWIDREIRVPTLIVTSLPRLQLPSDRFEVRLIDSLDELPGEAVPHYDLVVAAAVRELGRLPDVERLAQFASEDGDVERTITVLRPRPPVLEELRLVSPAGSPDAPAWDGRGDTCWEAPQGRVTAEVEWAEARRVDRVDVESGSRGEDWPQRLRLFGRRGGEWQRLDVHPIRPTRPVRFRRGAPYGQIYVLTPASPLTGIRVERPEGASWALCEVRVRGAR
jgi:4-amino-4-deoxy-L-arabinose transferase-like glycosyltransferase